MLNFTRARILRSGLFCALTALTVTSAGAASRTVASGGDLQGALNQAQGGDTITIAANAQFVGHFRLPVNLSGQWITIQSSAMSNLPSAGSRVSPSHAQYMPKLITPDGNPVLVIGSGANSYRIQGIEFTELSGVYVQDLVQAGTGGETNVSQLPQNIDFDRVYIHGDSRSGGKRGLALNSGATTVENSYFADFISNWQDTQAICGWNGSGPFTIQNNHLESGTEILAFGGATPAISGLIPSNITIQNNEFYKPTRYFEGSSDYGGIRVWAKNHLELKNAKNVTIKNNSFTNNFVQADQLGFTLVLNVRDEGGQVPWATVSDVTVANNTFQHVAAGVLLMGHDGDGGGTAGNFNFSNNLWTDMGVFGGDGRMYEILNGVQGANIDHDTAFPTGWLLVFDQGASSNIRVTNGIYNHGWDVGGAGCGAGESVMVCYDNNGVFQNNAVIGANTYYYTGSHFANNYFTSFDQMGFTNPANNDYSLSASSPYRGAGMDGKDLGAANSTTNPLLPNGWVEIVSKNSGKCLDVPYWAGSNWGLNVGTYLQQYTCSGGAMQKFQLVPVAGGYRIDINVSGLVLDMEGGPGAISNGMKMHQWSYWGGSNQIFQVNPTSDGYFTINPTHSGLCVDVEGVSKDNGAAVHQWSCWGGDNQKWSFVPVP